MGRGRDETGGAEHPPLVVALDIRPAHGPGSPAWPAILLGIGVIFAVPALYVASWRVIGPAPALFPELLLGCPALACFAGAAHSWWRLRRWRRWFESHPAPGRGEGGPDALATRYERCVRMALMEVRIDPDARTFVPGLKIMKAVHREDFHRHGLEAPRALVISPPRWRLDLQRIVEPTFVEPESVRARPGLFALRHPLRLAWTIATWAAIAIACWAVVSVLAMLIRGTYVPPGPRFLYRLFGALVFVGWMVLYAVNHVRSRGWFMEIQAAPSLVCVNRGGRVARYTPDNCMLVVRPCALMHGIAVTLATDGRIGSPPERRLNFFGFEDAGFLKLWRAWINPVRADRLATFDAPRWEHDDSR